jgi:hypothetical protein
LIQRVLYRSRCEHGGKLDEAEETLKRAGDLEVGGNL